MREKSEQEQVEKISNILLCDKLKGSFYCGRFVSDVEIRVATEMDSEMMITDWRITNLASSIFWPKCGFKPVAYRMVRYIDSNISWANFNNPSIKFL